MKRIFTLAIASLFTLSLLAADRRPSVTVQSARNYEIVIDGKIFASNKNVSMDINNLREGRHTISVYKVSQGFRKTRKLVSTSTFQLRNKDVNIFIDQSASIRIIESRNAKDRDDRRWDKDDKNYDRGYGDQKDRDRRDDRPRF